MTLRRLVRVFAALVASIACLLPLGAVHADSGAAPGTVGAAAPSNNGYAVRYIEVSAGMNRSRTRSDSGLSLDAETAPALGVAFGRIISPNARVEGEVAYLRGRWDVDTSPPGGLKRDAVHFGANLFFDIPASNSLFHFELGVGAGWAFADEDCVRHGGDDRLRAGTYCVDDDDWTLQAIIGGSYAVSRTGAVVARYNMRHYGKLSADNRVNAFTVGYRHYF